MPKLILKYEQRVLQEIPVGADEIGIGRLPDNAVAIDNAAVSGRHARIVREGDAYVLRDLHSTNGTFVNELLITEHTLQDGDVVQVGKHRRVFVDKGPEDPADPLPDPGGTLYLDTKAQKERLARAASQPGAPAPPSSPAPPARAPTTMAVLTVLSGRADSSGYVLKGQTMVIGSAQSGVVRLRGWFKPKMAAVIARRGEDYVLTPAAGSAR